MRTYRLVSTLVVCTLAQLGLSAKAHAITLPDNSSASCTSSNGCFRITNTANQAAVTGVSPGVGVTGQNTGTSATTVGVLGTSTNGYAGLFQNSTTGTTPALMGWATFAGASTPGVSGQGGIGVIGYSVNANSFGVVGRNAMAGGGGWGAAVYGDASANPGAIWAGRFDGDVTAWDMYANNFIPWSDARLKKDIQELPRGLKDVLKLRPVTFKWKQPEAGGEGTQVGLIAQEVQKIIPELVRSRQLGQTQLALNYDGLAPVLIKAVQEQQKLIEKQAARIDALERGRGSLLSSLASTPSLVVLLAFAGAGTFLSRRRRQSEQK
jgi:hypothetical protein